jgi:hypothetical protein
MADYGGFLLFCTDERRSDELQAAIKKEGCCYEVFVDSALGSKVIEIGFLSLRDSITHQDQISYIALIRRRTEAVVTRMYRIEFLKCVPLRPMRIDEFEHATNTKVDPYIIQNYEKKGKRVPPITWLSWITYVKELQPDVANAIDTLENTRQPPILTIPEGTSRSFALQQDAFGLALDMAGFDRNGVLPLWNPSTSQPANFLEGFFDHYVPEDKAIAYDVRVPLNDWHEFSRDVKGAVEFRNDDEVITIVNANRGPVEHTFGVDLVYYHHQHHSFVMVQYKTMGKTKDEKEFGYRPTGITYESEIEKMQKIHHLSRDIELSGKMPDDDLTYHNYRLNPDIFYFKVCDALMFERSPDLIDGLYFPLELWKKLLQSDEGKGNLGGLKIMRSNTLFIELTQKGWIGSRLQITDALNILMKVSLHSLELNRLVLWAKSRKLTSSDPESSLSRSIFSY